MNRFIKIILSLFVLAGCNPGNSPWGKNKSKDTLSVHSVPYEKLLDKAMDSAEQISFLKDYCIRNLDSHKRDDSFSTLDVLDGENHRKQL